MLEKLRDVLEGNRPDAHVTLIAAHPDDEVLGAGSRLSHWRNLTIVHVTDGAPRNLHDAKRYGFADAASYAAERRRELAAALERGDAAATLVELGYPDQSAIENLQRIVTDLVRQFSSYPPDFILTHPYEGGHPDHDSIAFAVAAAAQRVDLRNAVMAEFAGYHSRDGQLTSAEFLSNGGPAITFELTPAEEATKREMLSCFRTQQETLRPFRTDIERFRIAPGYDWTQPPHAGTLWYESYGWGIDGAQFRKAAARVATELEIPLSTSL